ncbi:MAG: long-chain fatty acid--CoA ligase [Vicinamibacteria bacterium]|nr:long-chain fatty acid--CoA ligase [Vicinamibacteria bacterium]
MDGLMMDVPLSIPLLLRRTEALFGHKPLVTRRADRSLQRCTYGECLRRARGLAAGLASLGVTPGDRVGTFCWNHSRHLEAYYGVPASGAVLHTLNIRLHADELAYIITHAGDAAIIVDKVLWPAFAPVRERLGNIPIIVISDDGDLPPGTIDYEQVVAATAPSDSLADIDEGAGALMCYTSGTTGRSKGVLYSHRSMVLHALTLSLPDCLNLRESDVVLAVVPMFHVNAWGLPFACAMLGSAQVLPGPCLDAASLVELFESERVTVTAGVPTIWHGVLKYLDEHPGHDLSSLRAMVVGGAAIPESTIRAFDTRHGLHIVHAWGMTETSPIGTISRVPSELASAPPDYQYAWRATQGRPAPMVEIRARSEQGLVAWDGMTMGELEVRGPWVAAAYYPGDVAMDRWTDDGWFRTGDIVTIAPSGCVTIQDRAKDLVKSGGEWISTVALESALVGHPWVSEVAVVAVPHPQWGERPLAVIVPVAGCQPTIEELRTFLAPRFAKWWLPDAVVLVDHLPKTGTGKLKKHEVRAMFKEQFAQEQRP